MGIPMYGDGDEDRENGDDHKKPPAESLNTLVTENGRVIHPRSTSSRVASLTSPYSLCTVLFVVELDTS
jgi:hypothetical protein